MLLSFRLPIKIFFLSLISLISFHAWAEDGITLEQAVAEGLKSNLDLIAAKYGIPIAEADARTAGLFNNPSVLFDTVFAPLNGGNWNQTNAGGPRQYDMIFSYPFDFSGKRSSAEKSAKDAVEIAKQSFEDAVRLKVLDIRLAYIDVIAQEHQLTLIHEKEESLKHLVTMTENRVGKQGRLPLLLMRAQLAYDQAKLDTLQKEISKRASLVNLSTQLGRSAGSLPIIAKTKLKDFKLQKLASKEALIEQAIKNRPDLAQLKLGLIKADHDIEFARAQVWDNFNVTAGLSSQGPTDAPAAGQSALAQAYSFNAGVTIPLPTFNRNQGNIEHANLMKEQIHKQLSSKELSIRQEVDGLYDQLEVGRNMIESYENFQLKRARDVRDAQQRLFGTGNSALLDYLDALSAYQTTVSSYYDTVADYKRNLSRLIASLSGDFTAAESSGDRK